jgi:hypothetical protein
LGPVSSLLLKRAAGSRPDDQPRALMQAAKRVPVFARSEFLQEVAEELADKSPGGGNLQRALAKA